MRCCRAQGGDPVLMANTGRLMLPGPWVTSPFRTAAQEQPLVLYSGLFVQRFSYQKSKTAAASLVQQEELVDLLPSATITYAGDWHTSAQDLRQPGIPAADTKQHTAHIADASITPIPLQGHADIIPHLRRCTR